MEHVDIHEAEKLVRSIRDDSNPQVSAVAIEIRDKWLLENDLGVLKMAVDVRAILESALDCRQEKS